MGAPVDVFGANAGKASTILVLDKEEGGVANCTTYYSTHYTAYDTTTTKCKQQQQPGAKHTWALSLKTEFSRAQVCSCRSTETSAGKGGEVLSRN